MEKAMFSKFCNMPGGNGNDPDPDKDPDKD